MNARQRLCRTTMLAGMLLVVSGLRSDSPVGEVAGSWPEQLRFGRLVDGRFVVEATFSIRRDESGWMTDSVTERGATRADDRFTEAAMEDRKKEGYF